MAADGPHKLAFVFGPVGWQRENMGRALYDKGGVYRAVFDEVARECRPALPVPLGDVVYPVKGASALDLSGMVDSTFYAQTSLYAVEVALDALYRSHGVAPAACCGHSIGEFSAAASGAAATFAAAADVEGQGNALIAAARDPPSTPPRLEASPARARALTVAEGARLVAARAKRMAEGAAPIAGCMMAVGVGADDCEAAIAEAGLRSSDVCEVGAVNGAGSTVLSGDAHAVARVVVVLREGGAKVRPRRVRGTSHADHSRRLIPIAASLARDVDGILHDKGSTALTMVVSTVTGKTADVATLRSGAHWAAHMTKRVEYVKAARCLARDHGVATFVEIGDGLLGRVTSGILTIIQVFRARILGTGFYLGTGLISVMGTSFTFLPIAREMVIREIRDASAAGKCDGGDCRGFGKEGYGKFLGTCMVASVFEIAISMMPSKVRKRLFPPVVTGCAVMLIGVSLISSGIKYVGGGVFCGENDFSRSAAFGSPQYCMPRRRRRRAAAASRRSATTSTRRSPGPASPPRRRTASSPRPTARPRRAATPTSGPARARRTRPREAGAAAARNAVGACGG